jgi:hypothetical protein
MTRVQLRADEQNGEYWQSIYTVLVLYAASLSIIMIHLGTVTDNYSKLSLYVQIISTLTERDSPRDSMV